MCVCMCIGQYPKSVLKINILGHPDEIFSDTYNYVAFCI